MKDQRHIIKHISALFSLIKYIKRRAFIAFVIANSH